MATQPSSALNPGAILLELNAYQRSMALKGALDLELFTFIDEGATTLAELAARTKASERGLRVLCDYLTIQGWLNKTGAAYSLSPNAKVFLSKRSPAYLGSMANFLVNERVLSNYRDVAETVRRGGAIGEDSPLAPDHPIWVEFARSMGDMSRVMAGETVNVVRTLMPEGPTQVLDIAAGHGRYGIAIAQAFPKARITGLDWKNVLEVALENARAAGVADRYRPLPGSAFDAEFGSGYDLVLVPNFCHHFDIPTNLRLLRKIQAALVPGGKIAIVEFVPNEDRVSPLIPAVFAFTMLNSTPSGDAYTLSQYREMLAETGFTGASLHEFAQAPQRLVTATRA